MRFLQEERPGDHKMKLITAKLVLKLLVACGLCLLLALSLNAQVQTQTNATTAGKTTQVNVERGEVVLVDGNDLVVKMEDGSIRHIPNVPESAKVEVDGKQLGIHDLKTGMKLEHTVTTTSTERTITTVQSVTGKVWHVNPPSSVVLTLENGTNQSFKIPKGQKFNIDGKMVDAWGLKKGMRISATKIVEEPQSVVEQEKKLTGMMPPPPPPPPADTPMLIVVVMHPPNPAEPASAPAELPKTGSLLPLVGLLGILCCGCSFGVKMLRWI
jgi:RNase P/RNase MRP subunit p29